MSGRVELMEAALEGYPEGIALLDAAGQILFWNRAAEAMTGFAGIETVARRTPWELEPLVHGDKPWEQAGRQAAAHTARAEVVHGKHKRGGDLAMATRRLVLRDGLGERIGVAVLFHPTEFVEPLARGEAGDDAGMEGTRAQLEMRLVERYEEFLRNGTVFGLLWITVDQAHMLRKTHGARACGSMLERMERTLAGGLYSGEELGRWGEDEFLLLAREPDPEALATRARTLAGLARTADFRWWGDRVSLTVSVGAAQALSTETLVALMGRAQAAMFSSLHAGGNHVTAAPGRHACSRS